MQKGLGGLGTLLMLGLGLGLLRNNAAPGAAVPSTKPATAGQQSAQPGTNRANHPAAQCSQPSCPEDDLLNTITAFFPGEEPAAGTSTLVLEFQKLAKSGNEISFAIALVPDPIHTHLSLFFDRTMDAIQQGAQQANWIFDRAIMPWDNQEHPESTDFRVRLQQQDYQADKEDLPGLMIFRPADPQKLNISLFIFVVGETPTGGVNKKQFKTAVNLIGVAAKPGSALRIIGPTFSGSLYSLAQLLNHELPPGQFSGIVIRSGTVSSWNTTQWFREQWFNSKLAVDFATFQQSDRYMLRKFLEFERCRGYTPDRIALLAEDETAYGNMGFRVAASGTPSATGPKQMPCHSGEPADEGTLQSDENSALHLYFPRNISQLRSAYQQGLQQQASSASSSDSYQVHSTLPLNLQDSGSDDDTVQQFAHSQTPLSQESILLGIVDAIRDRHIEFIVLQATNPMDTLFLSAFLKKGYSDARVVAMPADLLLSRDADDVSLLHGVMALTTYSLLPDIDETVAIPEGLDQGVHADHIFPNAYAAGTYNAALSQIICTWDATASLPGCAVTGTPTNLPVEHYAEYGWPSIGGVRTPTAPLSPVVWLTVLGRGGFWPLAILDDGSKPYRAGDINSAPRPIDADPQPRKFVPPWPLFWKIVCGLVLMLEVVYLLFLWKGSVLASFSAMTVLAPVKDSLRPVLIAVIAWIILAALLLLLGPWFSWAALGWVPSLPLIFGSIASLALCGICAQQLRRRQAARVAAIFIPVAAVVVVCFLLVFKIGGHSQNPFLYRYIHLTSGVSPLLPFLCLVAAGLWWAWFSLFGLALVDKRRPRLPAGGDLPAAVMYSAWLSEEFAEKLMHVARPSAWSRGVYGPALVLLAVTLSALSYGHPLLSLEARHYEWIFVLSLGVVTFALFCTLFRLLVIWLESHRILLALDRFPLRRAFGELNFAWQPIWRLGGGRWQDLYRLVSRQLETLDHLKPEAQKEGGGVGAVLVRSIEATAQERDELYQRYGVLLKPGNPDPNAKEPALSDYLIEEYRRLQESIAYTCAAAFSYLQPKWQKDEGLIVCEIASGEDVKKTEDNLKLPLSTRLAERFVALVYLNFILTALLRMRTLAITAGGLYIFLLLSVNSYPFEPRIALRSMAILLLMCVVGIVAYVFAQIHRDSILSLVTQTKPGELGVEFWVRIGTFTALPLLSLLVSQFPTLNNAVFSWLEPAVTALK